MPKRRVKVFAGVAACVAVPAAFAAPGDIVSSFSVPGLSLNGPRGLAFDGAETYAVADNRGPYQVRIVKFTYDGNAASVVGSFTCPAAVYWAMDIAWRPSPSRIYIASDPPGPNATAKIYVVDAATGVLTNQFAGPFPPGQHLNGLSWSGSYLYAGSYESKIIYRMNYLGSVQGSFAADHAANLGLAATTEYLWLVSGRPYYDARRYTTGGAKTASFTFDVGDEYVGGACRGRPDRHTLFISTYTGDRLIYEVATAPGVPENVAVLPASFGKLKALFR